MPSPALVEAIGTVAGVLTTGAFVPQVLKAWRTRRTRDVSLGMYAVLSAGVACWLAYGLLIGSLPIMAANGATLALALSVLVMKLRFG